MVSLYGVMHTLFNKFLEQIRRSKRDYASDSPTAIVTNSNLVGESLQKIALSGEISGAKSAKKKSKKKRKSARSFSGVEDAQAAPLLGPKLLVDGWSASASASDVVSNIVLPLHSTNKCRKYCSSSEVTIHHLKPR